MSMKKAEGISSFLEFLGVGLLTSLLLDYSVIFALFPENVTTYLHESAPCYLFILIRISCWCTCVTSPLIKQV